MVVLVGRQTVMTGAPHWECVYSDLDPEWKFPSLFLRLGPVLIMNTFWFYRIIQIHYDLCQIIGLVHVKNA